MQRAVSVGGYQAYVLGLVMCAATAGRAVALSGRSCKLPPLPRVRDSITKRCQF